MRRPESVPRGTENNNLCIENKLLVVGRLFLIYNLSMLNYTALIVAAGAGSRMGLGYNKAYYRMEDGRTILEHTMDVFRKDPDCRQLVVVTDSGDFRRIIGTDSEGKLVLVQGGDSREDSVWHGMQAVISDTVLIHDGARPYLPEECLEAIKEAMKEEQAACLMVPCKDTIKVVTDGYIRETLPRTELRAAQTPQAFRTELLLSCMRRARADGFEATDDCSIVERYADVPIRVVDGSYANLKITTIEDLHLPERSGN